MPLVYGIGTYKHSGHLWVVARHIKINFSRKLCVIHRKSLPFSLCTYDISYFPTSLWWLIKTELLIIFTIFRLQFIDPIENNDVWMKSLSFFYLILSSQWATTELKPLIFRWNEPKSILWFYATFFGMLERYNLTTLKQPEIKPALQIITHNFSINKVLVLL